MSYEGYDEILCSNGHRTVFDAYDSPLFDGVFRCTVKGCEGSLAWSTSVDQTNGIDEETGKCPGEVELEIDKPAKTCTCACGNVHVIVPETYKIPMGG